MIESPIESPQTHAEAMSLEDVIRNAQRAAMPLKAWRKDGERMVELYVYRDLILHAEFRGIEGTAAVQAMLLRRHLRYRIELGVWPRRHTLLLEVGALLQAVTA